MEVFRYAADAITPLILEICLGYCLRRFGMLSEQFFHQCRKLVFYIVVPISTFCCIYDTQSGTVLNWKLTVFAFAAVMVLFGLGTLISLGFSDRRKRGVIIQATYRSNYNIIAVPLSQALGGAEGLRTAAFLSVTTIPEFNILAVISMTIFVHGHQGKGSGKHLVLDILKNPMIVACLLGVLCLLLRGVLPQNAAGLPVVSLSGTLPFVYSALSAIGKMSTPLALITLGGLFDFRCLRGHSKELVLGTMLRTVLSPLLALGSAVALAALGVLEIQPAEYACLIAIFASPMATITGIMAAQMGNDDVFADQLVVSTTVVSAFTIFAIVCILRAAGLL